MAQELMQTRCTRCQKTLKSNKPLRVGATVKCPVCGESFRVEANGDPGAVASTPTAPTAPASPRTPPPVEPVATVAWAPGMAASRPTTPGRSWPIPSSASPSWPPRTPVPGAPEVPGYLILSELGRGGMGVVYKALHEQLKRVVALKVIGLNTQADPQYLAHFQAEAEAVARLHHPNIIQIFEIGEHQGRLYLALEFVQGGTLKSRLNGEPQPVRAAAQLVEVLARTVHAAHLRGIVHRDLKPANILLEPPGIGEERGGGREELFEAEHLYGVPKITDFGLALWVDDPAHPSRDMGISGTPLYMAPEQAQGRNEEVGPGTDVYSLGAILYELLTGRPPIQSDSIAQALARVVTEVPVSPRQLRRQLPRDLEAICLKCLEKDPRKRYRSALALADDLQRFLDGEPILARPVALPARLWNWALRNPIPASLLLTGTAVLVFGLWSLFHISQSMVEQTALEGAAQQAEMLREMNRLYTDVAAQAKKAGVVVTHRFPDDEKPVVPIPARFTILLGERLERQADEEDSRNRRFLQLKMYSKYPFRERVGSPPKHRFGVDALNYYETAKEKDTPFYRFDKYNGLRVLRYATPLIMKKNCLTCHNDASRYAGLSKTDWKEGDVRGVLELVCPLDESLVQTRQTLVGTYAILGGAAAILLIASWMGLTIARRRMRG